MKTLFFKILDILEKLFENHYLRMNDSQKIRALKIWYFLFTHEKLDLNNIRNFNEKMQWLKICDNTKIKEELSDKYLVRKWVKKKIGEQYLIKLLGDWFDPNQIEYDTLPDRFVLKANHGSGMNIIITDKSTIDKKRINKELEKFIKTPAGILALEQQYYFIQRRIIAEEFVETKDGDLRDYKIHCFNGKPMFIQVIGNRDNGKNNKETIQEAYLDLSWNKLPQLHNRYKLYKDTPPRPDNLEELIDIAKKLSEGFKYVRVDLYDVDGAIKFGEMTFTPAQGLGKWGRYIPREWWKDL